MGAKQSKEELLYQKVNHGSVEGIKTLRYAGAGLEWVDKKGKTPLILACVRSDLLHVAKVLIEMGANVNAYRPGSHAGTPLHHAARRGLQSTVNLLLSNGANPLSLNDDNQTPLDVARARRHSKIVRAIEKRACLFSGWLREISGPSILEAFIPQLMSKEIWAVVLPCNSRNPTNPRKFELALYSNLKFSHLQHTNFVSPPPAAPPLPNQLQTTTTLNPEDGELTMAINASIQTAMNEAVRLHHGQQVSDVGTSRWPHQPTSRPPKSPQPTKFTPTAISPQTPSVPSAPPISEDTFYAGSAQRPSVDSSSIDVERKVAKSGTNCSPSSCIICFDSRIEGACVPCGHMAGCMPCLEEIKAKKGECPVCRAKIEQIMRLYTV